MLKSGLVRGEKPGCKQESTARLLLHTSVSATPTCLLIWTFLLHITANVSHIVANIRGISTLAGAEVRRHIGSEKVPPYEADGRERVGQTQRVAEEEQNKKAYM